MAKFKIEIKRSAAKEIESLPKADIKKVMDKIGSLAENPHPIDSKKLCCNEKYRIRCGKYRILYTIKNEIFEIYVVKVGHRKDVYR